MKKILITDSLFIGAQEEELLQNAGFAIERLDVPKASEEQLIAALPGKAGYILGGVEEVTQKVINAADQLEVISFTGIGYKGFIPAWEDATKKGIAITNVPDAFTNSVAEWALTTTLAMQRSLFDLGRTGTKTFATTTGLEGQRIGIIGFGRIGRRIAEMIQTFKSASVSYSSLHEHPADASRIGVEHKELSALLHESDIVYVCVSKDAGENFLGAKELAQLHDDALLVTVAHEGTINTQALLAELQNGRLRAVSDDPLGDDFKALPLATWFCFNGSNAFNTKLGIERANSSTTQSIINVLTKGDDQYIVNPEFRQHKK